MNKPLILITRPEPDAARFAKLLAARHYASLTCPMLALTGREDVGKALNDAMKGALSGVLLTSRHAVPALEQKTILHHLRCFAVGTATARAAKRAGFTNITTAPTLKSLIPKIHAKTLLYARGKQVAHDAGALLAVKRVTLREVVVYEAHTTPTLPPKVIAAIKQGDVKAVTFFSARAAETFIESLRAANLEHATKRITAVSISARAEAPLKALSWHASAIAKAPRMSALAEAVDKALTRE